VTYLVSYYVFSSQLKVEVVPEVILIMLHKPYRTVLAGVGGYNIILV